MGSTTFSGFALTVSNSQAVKLTVIGLPGKPAFRNPVMPQFLNVFIELRKRIANSAWSIVYHFVKYRSPSSGRCVLIQRRWVCDSNRLGKCRSGFVGSRNYYITVPGPEIFAIVFPYFMCRFLRFLQRVSCPSLQEILWNDR